MGVDGHKNFALAPIAVAPAPALSGLVLTLQAGGGALMPTTAFDAPCWPPGVAPSAGNAEIVRVSSIVGDVVTLSARAQQGTVAKSIEAGWQFANMLTAKTIDDLVAMIEAAQAAAEAELDALSHVKPLGEVEGAVTPNLNEGMVFTLTLKGNATIEKPTNWPVGGELSEALLIIKQPPAGGKTVGFGAGVTPIGGQLNPEPNAISLFSIISTDNGVTALAVNAVEGKVGATGSVGPAAWATIAAWEAGKAYVVGPPASIVTNAGSCFVCIAPVSGATPPGEDGTHWSQIASKGTTGAVGPGGPPGATGATKALGNVSGTIKLNLAQALFWTMTVVGNLTIEFENWPAGGSEPELYITEDATGAHTITIPGVTWQNEAPEFFTTPNALNIVPLSSPDGGAHIYGIRGQRGATGATGGPGPTGPEGKAGAWVAVTLGAKMVYVEGEYPKTEARSEQGGSRGALRGNLEVKAAEELKAGETLLTLPEALWPTKTITRLCGAGASITAVPALNLIKISNKGVVTLAAALTAGKVIHLDEISWGLT